jgi:ribonuclease HI
MSDPSASVHIDGASRGNPGPAAFAFVINPPDGTPIEEHGTLGETTNNIAEYTALVRALERATELALHRLHIHSDSELLVKQMNGEYRVKNADLRELYDQAQDLARHFSSVRFTHVRREHNKRADELCNLALDGGKPKTAKAKPKADVTSATMSVDAMRDECVACLEAARNAWSARDPRAPSAAQVWDQLWSVVEESGMLKKKK